MRHHSGGEASAPAEDPSYTTDQPEGKAVKLVNISLKVSPKNNTKARLSILILSKAYPSTDIT